MDKKAADFLMTLYDEMYYWDPVEERRIYLQNGVHQGQLIAPMLFNLYFNEILAEWRTRVIVIVQALQMQQQKRRKITRALTYADDIVLLTNGGTSKILMEAMKFTLLEFNMIMNLGKCAYMANKDDAEMDNLGCQKVDSYEYLRVWLNTKGSIIKHYEKTHGYILKIC